MQPKKIAEEAKSGLNGLILKRKVQTALTNAAKCVVAREETASSGVGHLVAAFWPETSEWESPTNAILRNGTADGFQIELRSSRSPRRIARFLFRDRVQRWHGKTKSWEPAALLCWGILGVSCCTDRCQSSAHDALDSQVVVKC